MKKIFVLLMMTIFSLSLFSGSAIAGHNRYSGHGGHKYDHNRYSNRGHGGHSYSHKGHSHGYRWGAAAIGLGAGILGSAIINSYPRERVTVVERNTYYHPAPPPSHCRGDCGCCPDRYDAPSRVWVPGHYLYERGGHYRYIPGRWDE